ncbi:MAG: DUF1002 domain-containing protein [Thermincola sp.]|jgi:hypothetical protein|nr:DUF1002 domain-containing protein [Thermincola sp.]MDT3704885.1 DUF1002 domain-containing protein [Thermincola sp.]
MVERKTRLVAVLLPVTILVVLLACKLITAGNSRVNILGTDLTEPQKSMITTKQVSNEDLVKTGELGEQIGNDKAAELILLVKEQVAAEGTRDPDRIKQIVSEVAGDLKITLNSRQIDDITTLMQSTIGNGDQLKNWLQRILEVVNRVIEQVRSLILG